MILLATGNSDTFNNPTILGLLRKLLEKNAEVKVISHENYFANPFSEVELIRIPYSYEKNPGLDPIKRVKEVIEYIKFHFRLIKLAIKIKPRLIIGIDPNGLVLGRIFQRYANAIYGNRVKLDYLSFEIFFKDEGASKEREIEASKHINSLIIQDALRDDLLRKENNISDKVNSFYIPVSPLLKVNEEEKETDKFIPIRERYNLQEDTKMIVNFGSFEYWAGAQWIVSAIEKGLPENVVIVIHSRNSFHESNPLHQKIKELSRTNKQLILSDLYIRNQNEAISFLSQFDAGLTFYIPCGTIYTGKNIYHIGNASGKFSYYMAAHVPVITNDIPTYKLLNSRYNFGYIVENEGYFFNLLQQNPDFALLKKNCGRVFDELLNPAKPLEKYVDLILT